MASGKKLFIVMCKVGNAYNRRLQVECQAGQIMEGQNETDTSPTRESLLMYNKFKLDYNLCQPCC